MIDSGRVAIIYNSRISDAYSLAVTIANQLGLSHESSVFPAYREKEINFADNTSLIITIGGDGTILWAAQLAAPMRIPILGINMGAVGFMAELSPSDAVGRMDEYLNGETWIEKRTMITARVELEGASSKASDTYNCLNEIVVGRGNISRPIHLETYVDNILTSVHRADAIIVATATGSTGYSLSAGGPILQPQSTDIIINPVAPHLGLAPALVVPDLSTIRVKNTGEQTAYISVDGRYSIELQSESSVVINKSDMNTTFLRSGTDDYFYSSLLQRLRAGLDTRQG